MGIIMQEVTVIKREPTLVFALSGEIDSSNADDFYQAFIEEYRVAACDVEFDCTSLSFIDSTTLGTFVKILKKVKTDGHSLKLLHMQPRLKKLFVICKLDTIMEIS
jgi:anti-sigma B factor antagonist